MVLRKNRCKGRSCQSHHHCLLHVLSPLLRILIFTVSSDFSILL
jgi:hypothetical protein